MWTDLSSRVFLSPLDELLNVDVISNRCLREVDLQNLASRLCVGQRHVHDAVETTGSQQRGVDAVWSVRGCDDCDVSQRLDAVDFGEQLCEHAIRDVTSATASGSTLSRKRVDLVEEDDCWSGGTSASEQLADGLLRLTDVLIKQLRSLIKP